MKIARQSPQLQNKFQQQVQQKVSARREAVADSFGGGWLGAIGTTFHEIGQLRNQAKGFIGETIVSALLASLDDRWTAFPNALIPGSNGKLTEIDLLLIGSGGIFLIEVKTWSGSFSAYKDRWKQRSGSNWVAMENSPTQQSLYHQQMFQRYLKSRCPDFPASAISAPVVFLSAKWIGATQCSVPVCQGVGELKAAIASAGNCLSAELVEAVIAAIQNLEEPKSSIEKPILRQRPS